MLRKRSKCLVMFHFTATAIAEMAPQWSILETIFMAEMCGHYGVEIPGIILLLIPHDVLLAGRIILHFSWSFTLSLHHSSLRTRLHAGSAKKVGSC